MKFEIRCDVVDPPFQHCPSIILTSMLFHFCLGNQPSICATFQAYNTKQSFNLQVDFLHLLHVGYFSHILDFQAKSHLL